MTNDKETVKRRSINPGKNICDCFDNPLTYLDPCADCSYSARQSILAYEENLEDRNR